MPKIEMDSENNVVFINGRCYRVDLANTEKKYHEVFDRIVEDTTIKYNFSKYPHSLFLVGIRNDEEKILMEYNQFQEELNSDYTHVLKEIQGEFPDENSFGILKELVGRYFSWTKIERVNAGAPPTRSDVEWMKRINDLD